MVLRVLHKRRLLRLEWVLHWRGGLHTPRTRQVFLIILLVSLQLLLRRTILLILYSRLFFPLIERQRLLGLLLEWVLHWLLSPRLATGHLSPILGISNQAGLLPATKKTWGAAILLLLSPAKSKNLAHCPHVGRLLLRPVLHVAKRLRWVLLGYHRGVGLFKHF